MKKYVTPEVVITKLASEDIMSTSLPFVPFGQGFFDDKNDENDVFNTH